MSERLAECFAIDTVPFVLDLQEVANFASHQVQRIAAAARSEPSSLTPAAKWLQHLPVGSASWHVLHSGLCASGTEEAQGIVMNLLSDEKTPGPLRETIASNLHAIEFPTIWAVRRLNDLIDGLDAACRTPALLTLGSWIGKIDPCEERTAALARLQNLAQGGEQTAVLALGNSGLAEAFPYLAKLAQDKGHSLRPDAVRALRKIPLSDVDDILREAQNADEAAVRTEAAFACGFRTSPMLFAAQSERLECETDPCVRDQLAQNLARAEVGA